MNDLQTDIQGIPALIRVNTFKQVRGSFHPDAASDLDYLGYTEMDYEVLDRKGYLAPWLERKIDEHDEERIETMIHNKYGGQQ